ncbi:CHAD domain-containing protein [Thiocapsa marina]|uniref:CHAD domain containing protein n=1 Tax=Thiocapsa marina 5811 TaxID=768671 RepID=F9U8C0_9GAMM|nr:CHAD domain-containing protein [Thiocapsa marina]EGV19532.1 CHAD domain containing protein [Thiocapsa marina 5811]
MSDSTTELQIPHGTSTERVADLLQGRYRTVLAPAETVTRVFYDTFDWAIFHDGGALECRTRRSTRRLVRSSLDGRAPPVSQTLAGEPGFAFDLPLGPVRECVLEICGIRRLLPVVVVESHVTAFRLVNDEEESLLRVEIHAQSARTPEEEPCGPLGIRIRLVAEPYHEGVCREVEALLLEHLAPAPTSARKPLLTEALAVCGRRPGDYSSKIDNRLDSEQRADEALKTLLRSLHQTLLANLEGARRHLDTEFLHDLRVATRRTRSAIGQVKGVLPSERVEDFKVRFAWLQQVTGPLRDLDVYLLEFDRYRQALPCRLRARLDPVHAFLLQRQAEEQGRVAGALSSPAFDALTREWQAFLDLPVLEHPSEPNAARSIKSVADERIRRMEKRVRREGSAIRPDSPATDLHELRKSCKKLRYLMELFQSLYPRAKIAKLIKLLKVLLDHLGLVQDLAVQAEHLLDWAKQMHCEGSADTETLLAMGALVGQLLERQAQAREAFAEVFDRYRHDEHQALFRALFESG